MSVLLIVFKVYITIEKIQSILRSEGQGSSNIIDQLQNNLNDRDKIIKMLFEQVFFLENEVSSLNISFEDEISNLNFKIQLKNNRIDELTKRVNLNINIIQSMIDYVYENYSDVNIADLVEICNIERIEDNLLIPKDLATRESKDIAVVKNGDTERLILKIMEEETVSKDRELTSEIIEVLTNYKEIKNKLVYATTEYNKNIYLLKSIVCNDISVENDDILSLYTYSKFEDLINQVELKFKNITSNYEALQEEIIVLKEKNIVRQDLEDVIDKEENSIYVKGKYGETPESKSNGKDVNFEIKNYSNRLEEIMKELKIYHEDGAIRNLVSNISVLVNFILNVLL